MKGILPETYVSADVFLRRPSGLFLSHGSKPLCVAYFIPGNREYCSFPLQVPETSRPLEFGFSPLNCWLYFDLPPSLINGYVCLAGLLGFYHRFLSLLSDSLLLKQPDERQSGQSGYCATAGFSLGGFDLELPQSVKEAPASISSLQHPPGAPNGPIYSLQDQIELTYQRVEAFAQHLRDENGAEIQVILIGHSVGAYIALEVIRRLSASRSEGQAVAFEVAGAILLTPTIVDIAKSDSGRILTPLVSYIPAVPSLLQWATRGLVCVAPERTLGWIVSQATGMDLKSGALETVMKWLQSQNGVRQTLAMAAEEMRDITGDQWGEEVWGTAEDLANKELGRGKVEWRTPRLVLYFAGRGDHWVADATREEILRTRGQQRGGELRAGDGKMRWPRIETEQEGRVVHGWCINGSDFMAGEVIKWIQMIQVASER